MSNFVTGYDWRFAQGLETPENHNRMVEESKFAQNSGAVDGVTIKVDPDGRIFVPIDEILPPSGLENYDSRRKVTESNNQAFPYSAWATVLFDDEVVSTGDINYSNGIWTPGLGVYSVHASLGVRRSDNAGMKGYLYLQIRKNGSVVQQNMTNCGNSASPGFETIISGHISSIVVVDDPTDTIHIRAWQGTVSHPSGLALPNSGITIRLHQFSTFVSITRINSGA